MASWLSWGDRQYEDLTGRIDSWEVVVSWWLIALAAAGFTGLIWTCVLFG